MKKKKKLVFVMTHLHSIRRLGSCSLNEDNSGSKVCLCCNPLLGRVETLLSNGAIQTSQSIQQQYLCSAVRVLKLEAKFILAKRMKERNGDMINHIYIYIAVIYKKMEKETS